MKKRGTLKILHIQIILLLFILSENCHIISIVVPLDPIFRVLFGNCSLGIYVSLLLAATFMAQTTLMSTGG